MTMPWEKNLLAVTAVILFLGGLFGAIVGMYQLFTGRPVGEYGVSGIGGGLWLFFSSVAFYIRSKL